MFQSNKEVLIVEDEPMIRMVAADALADRGIFAWEAGDAHEALAVLDQQSSIRLLFTDVNMPGNMDGLDLAWRVHAVRPHVELIITSGAAVIENDALPEHGTFLGKPYPMDRLVKIVAEKLVVCENGNMELSGNLTDNLQAAVDSSKRLAGHPVHSETVQFWADLLQHARTLKADGHVDASAIDPLLAKLDLAVTERRAR
jgi:DNA-binding NtrC family response regulator